MKAILNGKLYSLVEMEHVNVTMEDENGHRFDVPLDSDIIFDPTDDEINNILPDYVPDDGSDGFELPDGTPTHAGSVNLDQLIGCNVRGRLTYIRDLCKRMDIKVAIDEINNLLEFFPIAKS